jgi:hypothetical protein
MADIDQIIAKLQGAIAALQEPFLALPEQGGITVALAYRKGLRDAYSAVLAALKEQPDG